MHIIYDLFMPKDVIHGKMEVLRSKDRTHGNQLLPQNEFQTSLLNTLQAV